jgi:hypothetical protein
MGKAIMKLGFDNFGFRYKIEPRFRSRFEAKYIYEPKFRFQIINRLAEA